MSRTDMVVTAGCYQVPARDGAERMTLVQSCIRLQLDQSSSCIAHPLPCNTAEQTSDEQLYRRGALACHLP